MKTLQHLLQFEMHVEQGHQVVSSLSIVVLKGYIMLEQINQIMIKMCIRVLIPVPLDVAYEPVNYEDLNQSIQLPYLLPTQILQQHEYEK